MHYNYIITMRIRIDQFTYLTSTKIFCGSFNLHAKSKLPESGGLGNWLCPSGEADSHVYALSFQEIVELNPMNVTVDIKSSHVASYWVETILGCLNSHAGSSGPFALVASKQLVGAFICIFVRDTLLPYVSDVRVASTACGVMGVMGNKGGVVARMKLFRRLIVSKMSH